MYTAVYECTCNSVFLCHYNNSVGVVWAEFESTMGVRGYIPGVGEVR